MKRRVLIIDDHELLRDSVKRLFGHQVAVFGEARSAQEAIELASVHDWHLVVLDLSLGDQSGLQLLRELKQLCPHVPVLVLTMHSEEYYARRAFKAGAAGYVTKDCSRAEVRQAITQVMAGGRYVTAPVKEKLIFDLERGTDRPPHEALSNREFEVLRLIAMGKTLTEIADLLSLSNKTISTHRAHILEKMGMETSAELTYYAIRNRLVR